MKRQTEKNFKMRSPHGERVKMKRRVSDSQKRKKLKRFPLNRVLQRANSQSKRLKSPASLSSDVL